MEINIAIKKGIEFLTFQQSDDGGFTSIFFQSLSNDNTRVTQVEEYEYFQQQSTDEYSLFPSMIIGHALLELKGYQGVENILKNIEEYLLLNKGGNDLWTHFGKGHEFASVIPYDLDDTAMASSFLVKRGIRSLKNQELILENMNRMKNFYTWVCFRRDMTWSLSFFKSCVNELKKPIRTHFFWKWTESDRGDVDAVVNANVLSYVGIREETRNVVAMIKNILRSDGEDNCDKWYRKSMTIYYAFSRCIKEFEDEFMDIRNLLTQKVLDRLSDDGGIMNNAMDTALGLTTLFNVCYSGKEKEAMGRFLLALQDTNGSWPCSIYYYGGPKKITGWGSDTIVTSLCLDALQNLEKETLDHL